MDSITQISPLWPSQEFTSTVKKTEPQDGFPIFSDVLNAAIENVRQTDEEMKQAEYLLSTGQLDNPAELSVASTKAELSVSMLVQLRDKALTAYTEVIKMGV